MKKLLIVLIYVLATLPVIQAEPAFRITRDKDALKLDIPDSLVGREFLLNTMIVGSTSPYIPLHRDISACKVFRLTRVDSTLVLLGGRDNCFVVDKDESLTNAIEKSYAGTVEYVFKIESHKDSLYRIDAGKLFDVNSKDVINLKGMAYSNYNVSSFTCSSDKSKLTDVESRGGSVAVRRDLTFELTLQTRTIVFELSDKYPASFETVTTFTLLEPGNMPHKAADPRIGTMNVPESTVSATRGFDEKNWISRWDITGDKTIDIYVDTLLTDWQRQAVKEGFECWNDAFEKIGLGRKIVVRDYPAENFCADDPLVSIVSLSGSESSISASFQSDGSDRILSARFYIPRNYVSSVRRRSVFTISMVDPRYREYELCPDAIAEVLRADVMSIAGQILGLRPNYAGSSSYSPEQLRDPAFVAEHGFTASVTDDVLFNYLARPGDRENGLATVVSRLGAYDEYALGFIYGDVVPDSAPEHFYAPLNNQLPDYRVRRYDLSNDSEADFAAALAELRYVADNGASWLIDEDSVENDYRILFLDWLWLRGNNMLYLITSNVGGYQYNTLREGSELEKFKALDAGLQRRSLHAAFEYMRDFAWLDSSELVKIAGANENVSDFSRQNAFKMVNAANRFKHVAIAEQNAGSAYTVAKYMKDLEKEVFAYIGKGKMPEGESFIVGQYISYLAGNVTVSAGDPVQGMSEISFKYLLRARKKLLHCRSKFSQQSERLQVDYLITYAEDKINKL